jgi:hypothetical protein
MNAEQASAALMTLRMEIAPKADPAARPSGGPAHRPGLGLHGLTQPSRGVAEAIGVNIPAADHVQVRSLRGLADYVTAYAAVGGVVPAHEGT